MAGYQTSTLRLRTAVTIAPGATVRCANSIYAALGLGRVQKVKGEQAKVEFNPGVFSKPPYRSENKILRLAELERCLTPLELAVRGEWGAAWQFELRQLAALFLCGNKGGQLSNARTEVFPHQIFTAFRVVSSPFRRFLLADEVGLGKTIETGMIWQALHQRGLAERTLIICPAGLTVQWQEEMKDKFDADFEIFGRDFLAVNPRVWDLKAFAIASIERLKRREHKRVLLENRRWDLIVFDEAHKLSKREFGSRRPDATKNYQLAASLRQYTDALLLLTATPHAGDENHSRFKNIMLLLEDHLDFTGLEEYGLFKPEGRHFAELVLRTPKKAVTDAEGRRVFKGRQTLRLPFKMYARHEKPFYDAVEKYIRHAFSHLNRIAEPAHRKAAGFVLTVFLKLNASSSAAIKHALSVRLARLQQKLDQLPETEPATDQFEFDERFQGEAQVEDALKSEGQILADEVQRLKQLIAMPVAQEKKATELQKLLARIDQESPRGSKEKVLIFTEYRKTQEFIVHLLREEYGGGSVVVINGDMKLDAKRESQRQFWHDEEVRFLVSTEAGGEGINLQCCHIVLNYDLPWNPMRVEQRVGRVYRIGQEKVVQVYQFQNRGTVEDRVRAYFERKVRYAATAICAVTGEDIEEVCSGLNGQIGSLSDPEDVYKRAIVEGDLNKQTKEEVDEAVKRARQAYEIATTSLFRDLSGYNFDRYRKDIASGLTLADLQRFTERFLTLNRRAIRRRDGYLAFLTPRVLRDYSVPTRLESVTFDRELALRNPHAQFLGIGHPFVDAMLDYVGSYDFGGHTAARLITHPQLAGRSGLQYNFIVRSRVQREDGDEYIFDLHTVVIGPDGRIDQALAALAVSPGIVAEEAEITPPVDPQRAYTVARAFLEEELPDLWDWEEDVDLLGVAIVHVV